ncbi:MAG: galactokinase [Phycisphaerae bacterium]
MSMTRFTPATLRDAFIARFGRPSETVTRAPGRVNLIGEHVDYCDGLVLPIAVEQATWIACAPRADRVANVFSTDPDQSHTWTLSDWKRGRDPHWTSYVAGVADLLMQRRAALRGFDMLIWSDVPRGAGVSSSAALTVAAALALTSLAGEPLDSREFIELCRRAENEFAGVPCGIMDQSASRWAREGHALLLDCRTLEHEHIPLNLDKHALLLIDSGVRHELADGEYAERRKQCEAAARYFRKLNPDVRSLRDVSFETARAHSSQMDPLAAARAMHVTSEIQRVREAASGLRRSDYATLGRLMYASHESLRDRYQVSCDELDRIVEQLRATRGVLGARLTGAGFGGNVIALVDAGAVDAANGSVAPLATRAFEVHPGGGAAIY